MVIGGRPLKFFDACVLSKPVKVAFKMRDMYRKGAQSVAPLHQLVKARNKMWPVLHKVVEPLGLDL